MTITGFTPLSGTTHRAEQAPPAPPADPAPGDSIDLSGLSGLPRFLTRTGETMGQHGRWATAAGVGVTAFALGGGSLLAGVVLGGLNVLHGIEAEKAQAALSAGKDGVNEAIANGQPYNPAKPAAAAINSLVGFGATYVGLSVFGLPGILLGLGATVAASYVNGKAAEEVGQHIRNQAQA